MTSAKVLKKIAIADQEKKNRVKDESNAPRKKKTTRKKNPINLAVLFLGR